MASWRDHKLRSFPPCVVNHWTFRLQVGMKLFLVGWKSGWPAVKPVGWAPKISCEVTRFWVAAVCLLLRICWWMIYHSCWLSANTSLKTMTASKQHHVPKPVLFCFAADFIEICMYIGPILPWFIIMFRIKIAALDWHVLVFSMFRHTEVSHLF